MFVSGAGANAGWLYSIDMRNWRIKNSEDTGTGANHAIEISPDGSILLALEIGFSPVKIYKYGINAGVFNYLDVDNHDLGSYLSNEVVDWARGKIYLASGAPYGIEVVSIDTLDRLGVYPMNAYPICVAMSADRKYIYGSHDDLYDRSIWMFNATDGTLMGSMSLNTSFVHLAIAHDLKSAYIGLPIQRVNLTPLIDSIYPAPGSQLGYSPSYFTFRLAGGLPQYDPQNVSVLVDSTVLSLHAFDMDGFWMYFRADLNQTLSEGLHNVSLSLRWTEQTLWENSTFTIDRVSPLSLKPKLYPDSPQSGSVVRSSSLNVSAFIVYSAVEWVAQGGWILLDGVNLTTTFNPQMLSATYNYTLDIGWHNISACVYWDGGLGKSWSNWSFVVKIGPHLTPIYPAKDQVLTQMPDHMEVAIDLGDTEGNVSAPQLYLDYTPLFTEMTPNGTMKADMMSTIRSGRHSAKATLDWTAGKEILLWEFVLDIFVGPTGETLERYEYKDEFSLLVPSGPNWTLEEDAELAGQVFPLVIYGPTFWDFGTNIIIEHASDRSVKESEEYLQEQFEKALADLEQSGIVAVVVVSPELRLVDNHTAYVATIQPAGYSVYQKVAIIASEDHEMIWMIILSTSISKYDSYSLMLDEMLESFKIEMSPPSDWGDLSQEAIGLGLATFVGGVSGTLVWLTRKRRDHSGPSRP